VIAAFATRTIRRRAGSLQLPVDPTTMLHMLVSIALRLMTPLRSRFGEAAAASFFFTTVGSDDK
jgi:hypothetical protein